MSTIISIDLEEWLSASWKIGVHNGSMHKRGAIRKNWKKRYFSLGWNSLSYFKDNFKLISKIDMLTCTKIENDITDDNQFLLTTPTRIWKFRCDNSEQKNKWIHQISFVIEQHQKKRNGSLIVRHIERIVGYTFYLLNIEFDLTSNVDSLLHMFTSLIHILSDDNVTYTEALRGNASSFLLLLKTLSASQVPDFEIIVSIISNELEILFLHNFQSNDSKNLVITEEQPIIKCDHDEIDRKSVSSNMILKFFNTLRKEEHLNTTNISMNESKENEEDETTYESVLRLTKSIRNLFLKQLETFQTQERGPFDNAQQDAIESATKLWDIVQSLIKKIGSICVLNTLIDANHQFNSALLESLKIMKDGNKNEIWNGDISTLKDKLLEVGNQLNKTSQNLTNAVSKASYFTFLESEFNEIVALFKNPYDGALEHSNSISKTLVSLVQMIVIQYHSFLSKKFETLEHQELVNGLRKACSKLLFIISECQSEQVQFSIYPKDLFVDVSQQIGEFMFQLMTIVEATTRSNHQSEKSYQLLSAIKRLYYSLEPVVYFEVVEDHKNETRIRSPKKSISHGDLSTKTNEIRQSKHSSILISRNENGSSDSWRNSMPMKSKVKKSKKTTPKKKLANHADEKQPSIWEENEEGNITYLSNYEVNIDSSVDIKKKSTRESQLFIPSKIIKAATLNVLIMNLTHESTVDVDFLKLFLATYRSFTTPEEFWSKIMERYNVPPLNTETHPMSTEEYQKNVISPIRFRVVNVLVRWVSMCLMDLSESLMEKFDHFMNDTLIKDGYQSLHIKLKLAKERAITERQLRIAEENAKVIRPRSGRDRMKKMQTLADAQIDKVQQPLIELLSDPQKIAEHLTHIEWSIFSKVKYVELLNQAWNKKELKHLSPNVLKVIARFNHVSAWVSSNILWQDKIEQRVLILSRFINVAKCTFELNNFSATMAILSGLSNSSVYRLKYTLSELSKKDKQTMEFLMNKLNDEGSFKDYRNLLKSSNPPLIPYLGVYLTDLTFIEDGNSDKIDNLINFHKRRLVYRVLSEIEQYQQKRYKFSIDHELISSLNNLSFIQDKELYSLSLLHEPRNAERLDIR